MAIPEPSLAVIEKASSVAAILSPLRREVLNRLHSQPDSASGLARRMGLTRQKLNYHVRTLEREGFLELAGEQKRRGCVERIFRSTARAYLIRPDLVGSLGSEPAEFRDRFSSACLINLAARTLRDVALLRRGAAQAGKRLATFALQVDVQFRTPADRAAFAEELTETVARLAARYQDDSAASRSYRFLLGGHPVVRDSEKQGESPDANNQD
jgi:DNA-binding transcriptional ArsR family regulator